MRKANDRRISKMVIFSSSPIKIIVFIVILLLKDSSSHNAWESYRNNRENYNGNSSYHPNRLNNEQYPVTKTQYYYKNIQTGSVNLPKGVPAIVSPNPNRTLAYTAKVETTIYAPSNLKRIHRSRHPEIITKTDLGQHTKKAKHCIRCPTDKTVIAQKGIDGVLIEMPHLYSCRNKRVSQNLYAIQTLFAPNFNFILPQGTHSFLGKIINKRTNEVVKTCQLNYKVIVRQCGKYYPVREDLKIDCDLGYIWGSSCKFKCINDQDLVEGDAHVYCGDSLQWEGEEPSIYDDCLQSVNDYPVTTCELPIPPDNGKFSCDMSNNSRKGNSDLNVPEGTICRIKCNSNYNIPQRLHQRSIFACQGGRWNSTLTHFCQPVKRRKFKYEES